MRLGIRPTFRENNFTTYRSSSLKPVSDNASIFSAASIPALLFTAGVLLFPGQLSLADQSAEENLAPISKLCLAGEDCVGAKVNEAAAPVAAAPAPAAAPEPVAEPVQIAQADDGFDLQATYQMFCFACHSTGLSGAPLPGDVEAWAPRMEKGRDEIIEIMNRGLNAMPPKGLCMTCTDDQLWELSQYMVTLEQ
ncbi:MAG: cytochrome c5 family protein [Gammaproteobacteria bacterium]|nr:cytochrome c5 family protein [Gammaproteobacteria bacterium]MYG95416.1 cytochrome c5 family protein [Gammaproteobacteria bacterium]